MKIKAKESPQIAKARKKLENQLELGNKQFTDKALERIRKTIYRWIDHNSPERVKLSEKSFKLFDENEHSEEIQNSFIKNRIDSLRSEAQVSIDAPPLYGRIKTQY